MTVRNDERDPAIEALTMLTTHEPDAARAERTLARGRALLAARTARRTVSTRLSQGHRWHLALEPLLVASASAVFLFEVFARAIELYRL